MLPYQMAPEARARGEPGGRVEAGTQASANHSPSSQRCPDLCVCVGVYVCVCVCVLCVPWLHLVGRSRFCEFLALSLLLCLCVFWRWSAAHSESDPPTCPAQGREYSGSWPAAVAMRARCLSTCPTCLPALPVYLPDLSTCPTCLPARPVCLPDLSACPTCLPDIRQGEDSLC